MLVSAAVRYDILFARLLIGLALYALVLVCTDDGRLPIAFALAFALFARSLSGIALWLTGAVVFLAALAAPYYWLASAN